MDPAPGRGCIHSRNLTNHPRGLANVTDDRAVKDMFLQGRRPDGRLLHPAMPAWELHAMPPEHADAIVAYLRTVPGVDHLVPAGEPPFDVPPVALPAPMNLALAPPVPAGAPKAAHRGRAMVAVACVGCHSPSPAERRADGLPVDPTRLFAGGRAFTASRMGQLMPASPAKVYSRNLTQHETGLRGWSEDDVVRVLKHGRDPKGRGVCAPMMGGPGREYGGLTDEDAHAIASYILTLPGIDNPVPATCEAP